MRLLIAFAVLIAGISALPQQGKHEIVVTDERIVTDAIVGVIEDLAQGIRDAGLDPLNIKRETISYALPVPVIFSVEAFIEELLVTGLSNIVVNNINFGVLTSRLTFDIELPLISATVDAVSVEAVFFGGNYGAQVAGGVGIQRIRVRGTAQINIGIISGISVRSIVIDFSLGGIISNLDLVVLGTDYSSQINTLLGTTIPSTLDAYSAEINELLGIILLDIINDIL